MVEDTLATAIRRRLAYSGKLESSGATLIVTIVNLRLRSTGTALVLGLLAGPDNLQADAQVVNKGVLVKSFSAVSNRTSGAVASPDAELRIDGMCKELASALVNQL